MRAVPFHARKHRLYLPVDICRQHGLDPNALLEGSRPNGLSEAVSVLAAEARGHLAAARLLSSYCPRSLRRALLPAVLADFYLDRLERANLFLIGWSKTAGARSNAASSLGGVAL